MKFVLFLGVAIICSAQTQKPRIETRTAEIAGHFYVIEFSVQYGMAYGPATYPSGRVHYGADITVYEIVSGRKEAIRTFLGQYTDGDCFEDEPISLIEQAYNGTTPPKIVEAIAAQRKNRAFEALAPYSESDGVLVVSAKGQRDLQEIRVGDTVVWRNPNPPKRSENFGPNRTIFLDPITRSTGGSTTIGDKK